MQNKRQKKRQRCGTSIEKADKFQRQRQRQNEVDNSPEFRRLGEEGGLKRSWLDACWAATVRNQQQDDSGGDMGASSGKRTQLWNPLEAIDVEGGEWQGHEIQFASIDVAGGDYGCGIEHGTYLPHCFGGPFQTVCSSKAKNHFGGYCLSTSAGSYSTSSSWPPMVADSVGFVDFSNVGLPQDSKKASALRKTRSEKRLKVMSDAQSLVTEAQARSKELNIKNARILKAQKEESTKHQAAQNAKLKTRNEEAQKQNDKAANKDRKESQVKLAKMMQQRSEKNDNDGGGDELGGDMAAEKGKSKRKRSRMNVGFSKMMTSLKMSRKSVVPVKVSTPFQRRLRPFERNFNDI